MSPGVHTDAGGLLSGTAQFSTCPADERVIVFSQLVLRFAVLACSLVVVGATLAEEYVVSVGGQVTVSAPQTGPPPESPPTMSIRLPIPSATPSTPTPGTAPVAPSTPRKTRATPVLVSRPRILVPHPSPPPTEAPVEPSSSPFDAHSSPSTPAPASPAQVLEPVPECTPQTVSDLTVVTLNTHRSYGSGGLEKVAAELSALDPDVVLLQEVDRFYSRTGHVDQVGWFAQRLGMNSAFGANVTHGRSQYGTAILSRAPIVEQANTMLPNGQGGEQRGLLRVAIDLGRVTISVYNTHLQNRLAGLRETQARRVAGVLASDPRPRIIGGDFNAGAGTPTLDALAAHVVDSWPQAGSGPHGTGPGGSRIDYLMASPDLQPVRSSVHRGAVSDHAALRTDYALATTSSC